VRISPSSEVSQAIEDALVALRQVMEENEKSRYSQIFYEHEQRRLAAIRQVGEQCIFLFAYQGVIDVGV